MNSCNMQSIACACMHHAVYSMCICRTMQSIACAHACTMHSVTCAHACTMHSITCRCMHSIACRCMHSIACRCMLHAWHYLLPPDFNDEWLLIKVLQELLSDWIDAEVFGVVEVWASASHTFCVSLLIQVELVATVNSPAQLGRHASGLDHL